MEKETMRIEVRLFAGLREGIGSDSAQVLCPRVCTAGDVKLAVIRLHPQVAELVRASRLALGLTFVEDHTRLESQSLGEFNVALIPPVSGG